MKNYRTAILSTARAAAADSDADLKRTIGMAGQTRYNASQPDIYFPLRL
jgi:hypothetical protein